MENTNTSVPLSTELNPNQKSKSVIGWIFGGLSFIPLIGVFFGIIAIIIGSVKKIKGQIILGALGILFSAILYGSLYYFGFVAQKGVFADMKIQLASQLINTNAGQISLYKNKNGTLPLKLTDLGTPSPENLFYVSDPWMTNFSYSLINNENFEIRSAGPDKIMNTQDDIKKSF